MWYSVFFLIYQYYSIGDGSILETAKKVKIEEELRSIKSRVDSEVKAKQEIEGRTEGVTLTKEEQKEILGKYFYEKKLIVDKNGTLCRHYLDNWKEYIDILEKIRNTTNKW